MTKQTHSNKDKICIKLHQNLKMHIICQAIYTSSRSPAPEHSDSARFDLRKLFTAKKSPLHLEICSGSGEWLSSQVPEPVILGKAVAKNMFFFTTFHQSASMSASFGKKDECMMRMQLDNPNRQHVLSMCIPCIRCKVLH